MNDSTVGLLVLAVAGLTVVTIFLGLAAMVWYVKLWAIEFARPYYVPLPVATPAQLTRPAERAGSGCAGMFLTIFAVVAVLGLGTVGYLLVIGA